MTTGRCHPLGKSVLLSYFTTTAWDVLIPTVEMKKPSLKADNWLLHRHKKINGSAWAWTSFWFQVHVHWAASQCRTGSANPRAQDNSGQKLCVPEASVIPHCRTEMHFPEPSVTPYYRVWKCMPQSPVLPTLQDRKYIPQSPMLLPTSGQKVCTPEPSVKRTLIRYRLIRF